MKETLKNTNSGEQSILIAKQQAYIRHLESELKSFEVSKENPVFKKLKDKLSIAGKKNQNLTIQNGRLKKFINAVFLEKGFGYPIIEKIKTSIEEGQDIAFILKFISEHK